MAEVKRKKGETFESLLRRFHRKFQQSGKLILSRKVQFYERPKNKAKKRTEALRRIQIRKKQEYLKKMGRLPELGYQDKYNKFR